MSKKEKKKNVFIHCMSTESWERQVKSEPKVIDTDSFKTRVPLNLEVVDLGRYQSRGASLPDDR